MGRGKRFVAGFSLPWGLPWSATIKPFLHKDAADQAASANEPCKIALAFFAGEICDLL
jgi:hypothetical protein